MRRFTLLVSIVTLVGCGPGASTSECEALFEHFAKLAKLSEVEEAIAEAKATMSSEPGAPLGEVDEAARALLDQHSGIVEDTREQVVQHCKKKFTSKQVKCMLRAKTVDELADCPPEDDPRDPDEVPDRALCDRVRSHTLEVFKTKFQRDHDEEAAFYQAQIKEARASGGTTEVYEEELAKIEKERRRHDELAADFANADERHCRHYLTRSQVECKLRATEPVALLRCSDE